MRVLVTQEIDESGVALLKASKLDVDFRVGPAPIGREELLDRVRGCDGLISMPTDRIDGAVMEAGPLRIVANHAVGLDNVDREAAAQRGVVVTHTPGVLTDATADLAVALLLAVARRVVEGDSLVRAGRFVGWRPTMLRGLELRGAQLGIVGMGRIGRAVADRARAFGMTVAFSGRTNGMALDELLASSDVISLHCPLTPDTRHLIGEDQLRMMRKHAVLINTSRGPVVDEAMLARALSEGWIAGAGLDVFEQEPQVHPDLLGEPKAVLLPHLGSATYVARRAMACMAASDLLAVLAGEAPENPAP